MWATKMGLDESTFSYLGESVEVEPFYGWGWCRLNPDDPELSYDEMAGPAMFNARILGFFEHDGELRGAKMKIEEPGHSFDGWFAVFSTRHAGEFDFESRAPNVNIEIGPEIEEADWPHVRGSRALGGFAIVRRSDHS